MTVEEFLRAYAGVWEFEVRLVDANSDSDEEVVILHTNADGLSNAWKNAEVESWTIRKADEDGAAFALSLVVIKED